ncbi:MAG: S1-like domain-containing RNA-binding protein [Proteobacteria bacterium]|nr:S1-like domain-containing RNA-binding protein [Pseudomonadota bacterium]
MILAELLGRHVRLPVRRFAAAGAFLGLDADEEGETILLPEREVPEGTKRGDEVEVFICLDSEERAIATTVTPKLTLGQVTFLEVTAVTSIGAFVDWGLGKELLVPFAEQARELVVGERHPFGLYVDKSGRLAATMYVTEMLDDNALTRRRVAIDEWIVGEAWRNDPDIGLFVILEKTIVGLVPALEPHGLRRGDEARFRVAELLRDGKLVLSLRQHAYQELANDAERIFERLRRADAPRVGDHSSPDDLRALFGISKKAFKRAIGTLLKAGRVTIDQDGFVVAVIARTGSQA